MRIVQLLSVILVAVVASSLNAQSVEISEFLTINDDILRDADNDTPDWIELRNDGPGSVDLQGWYLTDDAQNLTKWAFPSVELGEDAYLLVFASGKDRVDDGGSGVDGRDSTTFAHRLEFDNDGVPPQQEGAADGWTIDNFNFGANAATPQLWVDGGALEFETALGGQWSLINSAAWADEIDPGTDYTFEVRLRVTSASGSNPGAILWLANGSERIIVRVEENRVVTWSGDILHVGDNSNDFVTIRITHDASGYDVWRNGQSIGTNLGNEGNDTRRSVFLIDCCSSVQVAGEFDFVRWDSSGAFSPDEGPDAGQPEIHTNFSLDSGGEYLALVSPDGQTVVSEFAPEYPRQHRNFSYGPDGFYPEPTPGAPNGDAVAGFAGEPSYSHERGFFDDAFDLTLETSTPSATIRYTTDSSKPSRTHGTIYSGPIRVDTTTPVRAVAYSDELYESRVITHTFLFLEDVLRQTGAGFPVDSDWDYVMDPNIVDDDRFSGDWIADFRSLPTLSLVLPREEMFGPGGIHANPTAQGTAWERETSVEWILEDSTGSIQIDAGVRIQGAGSRRRDIGKKSFRLAFRGDYGFGKFRFPIYGPESANEFDTLVLRGNYFDSWTVHTSGDGETIGRQSAMLLRDAFAYGSQTAMGQRSLSGTWVHLYIDGLYWGLYNVTERPDEEFAAEYFGGDPDDYDVYKHGGPELVHGTRDSWNELMALVKNNNVASDAVYAQVEELLAMESFVDYLILNFWGGNQDWPHNNWYAFRDKEDGEPFHFVSWDAENFIFRLAESGKINTSVDNSPGILYSRLRLNEEFRVLFGDRVRRHLFHDGVLTPQVASDRFQSIVNEISGAMDCESARWGDTRIEPPRNTIDTFLVTVNDKIGRYFPQRTDIVLGQFRGVGLYPDLDAPEFNQHGGAIDRGFALSVSASAGDVYFTLDGEDPRERGGTISASAIEAGSEGIALIDAGATARAIVPTDDTLGHTWTEVDFDDATWRSGTSGVGYERSSGFEDFIGLDVEDLSFDINESVYIRMTFELASSPASIALLTLRLRYDDGFVAYLNGVEIASRNAPESPTWNSGATRGHTDSQATLFQNIDVSAGRTALREGANVLAIHGLNAGANSSDLLFDVQLLAVESTAEGVILDRTTRAKARALEDGGWSAINEAIFAVDTSALRVTELMYNPPPAPEGSLFGSEDFEFLELQNVGEFPLNLLEARIRGGIEFTFPGSPSWEEDLQPGEVVLVVKNLAAFESVYDTSGMRIAGEYRGNLGNRFDRLTIEDAIGRTILDFSYFDSWEPLTDGRGRSLEILDPTNEPDTWNAPGSWERSDAEGGTPGVGVSVTSGGLQLPSDINQDAAIDVSDAVGLLGHLFGGNTPVLACGDGTLNDPANRQLLDASGDARVDLSDAVFLLNYLFQGGQDPVGGTQCVRVDTCPNVCDQ